MSNIKIQGNSSGSGTVTLEAPNTNTDRTLTLPDGAGELLTTTGDGSGLTNIPVVNEFANFYYYGAGVTITNTGAGVQNPISNLGASNGINVSTANNNWTHDKTGYYMITIRYRQASGGDIWSVWGVLKNGSEAVGISARTGSEDGHNEAYDILYKVDSTSATYQINGWSGGTKTIVQPPSQGKPSWTNYDALFGSSDANGGRMIDYIIVRVGDL